jgi:hypothetical protein
MTSFNVFMVALLLVGYSTCDAQVSKCVDERSGAVRYTDGPCPSQSKTSTPRLTDNSADGSQYRGIAKPREVRAEPKTAKFRQSRQLVARPWPTSTGCRPETSWIADLATTW